MIATDLKEQLVASQAREQMLREAIKTIEAAWTSKDAYDTVFITTVLSTPSDDTALRQWGAKLLREIAERDALIAETLRMRHRIECLRGGLKSAAGWLLDADDLAGHEKCLEMAGDMEPPLMGSNGGVEGAARLCAQLPSDEMVCLKERT